MLVLASLPSRSPYARISRCVYSDVGRSLGDMVSALGIMGALNLQHKMWKIRGTPYLLHSCLLACPVTCT
eukprot:51030-Eustigmatos_ZCMA.PRE.1